MRASIASIAFALLVSIVSDDLQASECAEREPVGAEKARWTAGERKEYAEPGGGFSVRFRGRYGVATVFLYDALQDGWSEGLTDPRLPKQLEETVAAVLELSRTGRYSDVALGQRTEVRFYCQDFFVVLITGKLDGKRVKSATAVSIRHGKVLKLRVSFFEEPLLGIEGELTALVRTVTKTEAFQ